MKHCGVLRCERPCHQRGFCKAHYTRLWKYGDPLATFPTPMERFWSKIDRVDGCWIWTAAKFWQGYGQFSVKSRGIKAHRFAYETMVGPIPDGLELDHTCRNRACVNPAHLEPVEHVVNVRRGNAGWNLRSEHRRAA